MQTGRLHKTVYQYYDGSVHLHEVYLTENVIISFAAKLRCK